MGNPVSNGRSGVAVDAWMVVGDVAGSTGADVLEGMRSLALAIGVEVTGSMDGLTLGEISVSWVCSFVAVSSSCGGGVLVPCETGISNLPLNSAWAKAINTKASPNSRIRGRTRCNELSSALIIARPNQLLCQPCGHLSPDEEIAMAQFCKQATLARVFIACTDRSLAYVLIV